MTSLVIISCGQDDESSTTSSSTTTYNGPGSEWTMSISGTTYTISMTDGSDSLSVTTTGSDLTSGHKKLTVTSATAAGSASAPSTGDVAHAVEVPGVAFLLKPMDPDAETIAMVSSGTCPTSDFNANWVIGGRDYSVSSNSTATNTSKDWLGDISWNTTTGDATFSSQYNMETTTDLLGTDQVQTIGTCSDGTVSTSSIKVYFTTAGVAIVTTNKDSADESNIIAVPQITLSSMSDLYGDYKGFYYEDLASPASYAASGTFALSSGTTANLTVNKLSGSDLDTSTSFGTVSFDTSTGINSPANGFIRGAFGTCSANGSGSDGSCEVSCAAATNVNSSGKVLLYCIGQHPSDEDRRVTMLFVSK